jgi:hypothetical protein
VALLDQSRLGQSLERLAERPTVDPERLAQVALRRERLPGLDPMGEDLADELIEDRIRE